MKMPSFFRPRLERKIGTVGVWFSELSQITETNRNPIVEYDISNLETINSEEVSALVATQLRLSQEGRMLCLLNAKDSIKEVFELTRMDRLIQLRWPKAESDSQAALNTAGVA